MTREVNVALLFLISAIPTKNNFEDKVFYTTFMCKNFLRAFSKDGIRFLPIGSIQSRSSFSVTGKTFLQIIGTSSFVDLAK